MLLVPPEHATVGTTGGAILVGSTTVGATAGNAADGVGRCCTGGTLTKRAGESETDVLMLLVVIESVTADTDGGSTAAGTAGAGRVTKRSIDPTADDDAVKRSASSLRALAA